MRVVPCVVGPVPQNRDSKQRRALILSVYLRPWTWSQKLADADVKQLCALDLLPALVCNSWKTYLTHVLPHSFNIIRNFLACCMAEGKNDTAEDSDGEGNEKVIPFTWNVDHVDAALNHVRKEFKDDTAITKQVEQSTASARDLLRLAGQNLQAPQVQPFHIYLMQLPQTKKQGTSLSRSSNIN